MASAGPPELSSWNLPSGVKETTSEHFAGIVNIQAKNWLPAETAAQPLASLDMGSKEGPL
eukprot:6500116-Pyramimonas_sp.AAC.1